MQRLVDDISDAAGRVDVFFQREKATRKFLIERIGFAAAQIVGPEPKVEIGRGNLELAKRDIVNAAYASRRKYMWQFTRLVARLSLPLLILGALCLAVTSGPIAICDTTFTSPSWLPLVVIALWIPAGGGIGALTEFLLRPDTLQYSDIMSFDPGRWDPKARFVIVMIVGYVTAFVLWSGVFSIGFGDHKLEDFTRDKLWLAIVIGFMTGFAFSSVRDRLISLRPKQTST